MKCKVIRSWVLATAPRPFPVFPGSLSYPVAGPQPVILEGTLYIWLLQFGFHHISVVYSVVGPILLFQKKKNILRA